MIIDYKIFILKSQTRVYSFLTIMVDMRLQFRIVKWFFGISASLPVFLTYFGNLHAYAGKFNVSGRQILPEFLNGIA